MTQIVDKLNEIAKAIDESVELPETGLITDSLDAITKAFGGTPTESGLIVDKLADIAGVASGGGGSRSVPTVDVKVDLTALMYGITTRYYYVNADNIICCNPEYLLNGGATEDITPIAFGMEEPDTPIMYAAYLDGLDSGSYTVTSSSEVNCTYLNGFVVITDVSSPCSITLTVALNGGIS